MIDTPNNTPKQPPRLGRHLALIGLVSALVLALGLIGMAGLTMHRVDVLLRRHASDDAFRQAEDIRHLLLNAVQTAQSPADLNAAVTGWLDPMLQKLVAQDPRLDYAMVITPSGQVVAHSSPAERKQQLPPGVLARIAPPLTIGRWEVVVQSWTNHEPVADCSVPAMLGQTELGSIHMGLRQSQLEERIAEAQALVGPMLLITGLAALLVLIATIGVTWAAVRHSRESTRQLVRAQRRAEVASLTSGLVHEIRNPLNAMRMQVAVLRRKLIPAAAPGPDASLAAVTLDRLEGEVLRLQRLAGDFLDYGRAPGAPGQDADLAAVLTEAADLVRPEFEQAGLHLSLEADKSADGFRAPIEPGQFKQVVLNLASNARQAMASGGKLAIRLERVSPRRALITFADTGPGIPVEALPHVFDLFYSTRPGGTGLGLPIVRQIVEDAGGQISVRSDPGQGTRFEIQLPAAQPADSRTRT